MLALASPRAAWAQDPPCPEASTENYAGSLASGASYSIAINQKPCEEVSFVVSTTGHELYGASMVFAAYNSEEVPQQIFQSSWPSYGTVVNELPATPPWFTTYRGTRGIEGLIGDITITNSFSFFSASYSITVTRSPREGYNLGGTSFDTAPLISSSSVNYGTVSNLEPGQYYKIHLDGNQTIFVTGNVLGFQNVGTYFIIDLYDAIHTFVQHMVSIAAYGLVSFPASSPLSYTNQSSNGADYFLKVVAQDWPAHDFNFSVQVSGGTTSLSVSPSVLNISTGDSNKFVTTTANPSSTTFVPTFTIGSTTNPNSRCLATPRFSGNGGTGSVNTTVTARPAGCSGIFQNVRARFSSAVSSNSVQITVPPQIMIKMAVGEAGGLGDTEQQSILVSARNRFGDSGFPGGTAATWQAVVIPGQYYGASDPTTNGPEPALWNAAQVFTWTTSDIVAGSKCYWSPTNAQWSVIQTALQSGTSDFPSGTGAPSCWTTTTKQIVYKTSIGLNVTGGSNYSNAPAFVFLRLRASSDPAAVQIQ